MPRRSKGARLYLKGKGDRAVWIIRDGAARIATGCRAGDRSQAEIRLAAYIAQKHTPERSKRDLDQIPVADVISIYLTDIVANNPLEEQRARAAGRAERLLAFFGTRMLSEITGALCRAYRNHRGSDGGARRDLQDLSAAIGHHRKEGFHRELVAVWLPPAGERREEWLTRSEIARLVWAAWSFRSAMPVPSQYRAGALSPGARRPTQHIARAILFAYYTGSRPGDALNASFHASAGRSFVDLDAGVFYRRPIGKRATTKRQPPCRLGDRILAHLRRWRDKPCVASYVVEHEGRPVKSIKTGLTGVISRAGFEGRKISSYTLRHSRATHMLQGGISTWDTAGALGTSEAMIEKHYGHHHPDAGRAAANVR